MWDVQITIVLLDMGLISIIVFLSFLLSVLCLLQKRQLAPHNVQLRPQIGENSPQIGENSLQSLELRGGGNDVRFHQNNKTFLRVSETISLFTAVFLLCNLPIFSFYVLENCIHWLKLSHGILDGPGMTWYALLVGYVAMTALNSAINPCLYVARMAKFREWIKGGVWKMRGVFVARCLRRSPDQ